MKIIPISSPFDYYPKDQMKTTSGADDIENAKYLSWFGAELNDKVFFIFGYQKVSSGVASVVGYGLANAAKSLVTGYGYKVYKTFLSSLFTSGFTKLIASTLINNKKAIRITKKLGFTPYKKDSNTIYWELRSK